MRRGQLGHARALVVPMAVLVAIAGLSGCGGSASSARERSKEEATRKDPGRWLSVDSAAKTATITLELAYDEEESGFNIDGAVKGALLFSVPSGWRVRVRCLNHASERRYSCVLARAPGVPIVDPGAVDVLHPTDGLASGESFSFSFEAPRPTRYRLVAVSKEQQPTGMWVILKITHGGKPYAHWRG